MLGAGAVGAVIGAAFTARVARRLGVGGAFTLSCVIFPAPAILIPLAGGMSKPIVLLLLFGAEFGSGVGVVMLDITIGAMLTATVPATLRARVSGAYSTINYGLRPVGALAGGALGSTLGLRPTMWIATTAALLGVLWLLPSPIPRLRSLPELDDADDDVGAGVPMPGAGSSQVAGTKSGPTSS